MVCQSRCTKCILRTRKNNIESFRPPYIESVRGRYVSALALDRALGLKVYTAGVLGSMTSVACSL